MAWLTAIVPCKGRLAHLKESLPTLLAQTEPIDVVVVDYDCPDGAAGWIAATHPGVRVVRVQDRPIFNASMARNLGAAAAFTEWFAFLDADVRVDEGFAAALRERVRPGAFFLADPADSVLFGALVVARADFEASGGYDEVIEGWGSEDTDLYWRLRIGGLAQAGFASALLAAIPHAPELRTRYHAPGDFRTTAQINVCYRVVKADLLRHGIAFDLEHRRRLYADVRRAFEAPGGARSLQVAYKRETLAGLGVTSMLRYELDPRAEISGSPLPGD